MRPETNTIISIIAISILIVLMVILNRKRNRPHERRAFRMYLLTVIVWSLSSVAILNGNPAAPIWSRVRVASTLGSAIVLFYFAQMSLGNRQRWTRWVYFSGILAIAATMLIKSTVRMARADNNAVHIPPTIFQGFLFAACTAFAVIGFYQLIQHYRQANIAAHRNRLRYIILSLFILSSITILSNTPLGKYHATVFAYVFTAVMVTITLIRDHLMDIETIIRNSLLQSGPTIIIGASYFLLFTLVSRVFTGVSNVQLLLISMLVAIAAAALAQPLRARTQSWIDKVFFREKYDSSLMLQRVSRTAATFLEVNMLTSMILDEVVTTLHIEKAAIFLRDNISKEFRIVAHRNLGRNTNIRLLPNHPVVQEISKSETTLNQYDTKILPQFKSLWRQERLVLERIGAEMYIPLRAQAGLIGILAVGNKQNEMEYTQNDQSTLITLANQTAVAIENARLYSLEQTKRKELDSLYSLSRELIATEDMKTVYENVVEHALGSIHVTFARIITRDENGRFFCKAIHPVVGLGYDLRLGQEEPDSVSRHYERALRLNTPIVLDRNKLTYSYKERKALFLEHVHSLCVCPLRIGGEPIGILVMGERRHANREYFDSDKLRLAVAIADQAASAIQRVRFHEQLEESFIQTVLALANAIDARDSYTSDHGERLAKLATSTARELNCSEDEIRAIYWAMHLHDIGKIGVPDEILQKPGALTDEEWEMMKKHPQIGAEIIAPVKQMENVAPLIHAHHEKFDGSGYPNKLSKEQIPLGARILTVVDSYGAMTDDRVYRKALSHEEAIREITRCSGSHFDPVVARAFIKTIHELREKGEDPLPNGVKKQAIAAN